MLAPESSSMSEQDIQIIANQFPALCGSAFAAARERVLESGQSVLESPDGVICEVFPDGQKLQVKRIAPPTPAVGGVFSPSGGFTHPAAESDDKA